MTLRVFASLVPALALLGCAPPTPGDPGATTHDTDDSAGDLPGWPTLSDPCDLDPPDPRWLVLTTSDFSTGAVTVVDLETGEVIPDVAFASPDAVPFGSNRGLTVVNRFQHDYLDVLDPGPPWSSRLEVKLTDPDVASTNPHAVAVSDDGLIHATLFAVPFVAVVDPTLPPDQAVVDRIPLWRFADDDGSPEASHVFTCGRTLFVSLEHLDRNAGYAPLGHDRIAAVDLDARAPHADLLTIQGEFIKQIRRDPTDAAGHTVLVLSTGLERVDLPTRQITWAVADTAFAAAGLDHRFLPQSFDVTADGQWAYLSAYDADFSQVRLYRVSLSAGPDAALEEIGAGFDSVERTLEVVGDTLWYGSTRSEARGLFRFDLSTDPPTEVAGPLATGLPPYSLTTLP